LPVVLFILYWIGYYTKTGLNPDLPDPPKAEKARMPELLKEKPEQNLRDTIINLETVNPIEFFGVNNGKLDILKKKFPLLKILSRGTQLKLSGAPEQVEGAKEKIDLIVQYLERNGHMSENYFEQILGGDDAETVDNFVERNPNDVLVFGPNGKTVRARTANQKRLVTAAEKNDVVFAIGPAGTGKTYTAVAMAVRALKNKAVKKIILTRPAVEAGESLGFLPGDLKEKIDPYLRPLYDALDDMIPADKLGYYMTTRTIEIAPLAYMRGRTLDNCFIILDEAQNATDLQIKMFLTRIGGNAKAIITGDLTQVDLPRNQKSGLAKASRILKNIDGIGYIELDEEDVVRHKLVKAILKAYDKEGQREQELEEIEKKERKERRYYDRERDRDRD
jgi:phosphate starvation-inducible PhoH-like protein